MEVDKALFTKRKSPTSMFYSFEVSYRALKEGGTAESPERVRNLQMLGTNR